MRAFTVLVVEIFFTLVFSNFQIFKSWESAGNLPFKSNLALKFK